MKKLLIGCIFAIFALFALSGCRGLITGYDYSKTDLVVMYKVVKNGVVTYMSEEEIAKAKLDKLDVIVTDTYKIMEASEVAAGKAE